MTVVTAGNTGSSGSSRARAGSVSIGRDAAAVEVAGAVFDVARGAAGEADAVVEVLLLAALGASAKATHQTHRRGRVSRWCGVNQVGFQSACGGIRPMTYSPRFIVRTAVTAVDPGSAIGRNGRRDLSVCACVCVGPGVGVDVGVGGFGAVPPEAAVAVFGEACGAVRDALTLVEVLLFAAHGAPAKRDAGCKSVTLRQSG